MGRQVHIFFVRGKIFGVTICLKKTVISLPDVNKFGHSNSLLSIYPKGIVAKDTHI